MDKVFIGMKDKSLELLTEEELKLHEEFHICKTEEEVEEFLKKVERLNESCENKEVTHLDMTLEEFRAKYHTVSYDEVRRKMKEPTLQINN